MINGNVLAGDSLDRFGEVMRLRSENFRRDCVTPWEFRRKLRAQGGRHGKKARAHAAAPRKTSGGARGLLGHG